jgi:hypothetical protein
MSTTIDGDITDDDRDIRYFVEVSYQLEKDPEGRICGRSVCDVKILTAQVKVGSNRNPLAWRVNQPGRIDLWLDVDGVECICRDWFVSHYADEMQRLVDAHCPPTNAHEASHV